MAMKVVAGIDIGGTNTVVGLVTREGKCVSQKSLQTRIEGNFTDYIEKVVANINAQMGASSESLFLAGVGVGAPNGSYNLGAIVDAPNLVWKGILPVCKELTARLNVPSALTNDANAAALGEMLFGDAKGLKNFIVITLGTGLGSGIVVDGKLLVGHDGFAGELGHTTAKPYGRYCGCGKRGCLETYVSAPGIRRTAFKLLADYHTQSLLRAYPYEQLTAKCITQAALKGDKIAREAFEYTGHMLGLKLADVVALFSPEAIFLFGGLSKAGELLFEPTKRHMEDNLFPIFRNKVKLLPSGLLDENTAVLGAAALIWQELEDKGS
jgi:glucokinase